MWPSVEILPTCHQERVSEDAFPILSQHFLDVHHLKQPDKVNSDQGVFHPYIGDIIICLVGKINPHVGGVQSEGEI